MSRIDWKEYALRLADVAKMRSEDPYRQVGAAALSQNNRVLGVAYNGLAPGKIVTPEFWEDRDARLPFMIHAETNLLSLCKQGEPKLIACTLLPCSSCAQAICTYGVEEVVYGEEYHRDQKSKDIFEFYGVKLTYIKL